MSSGVTLGVVQFFFAASWIGTRSGISRISALKALCR